jgi:ParB-like chromosome segregation protein Spo0J
MSKYEDHPIAATFPILVDSELHELAEDIRKNGLLNDILIYQGKILDGRNRYRACKIAGVQPTTCQYAGRDPVGHVVSLNLYRRQLRESQRAMVAAKIATLGEGRPSKTVSIDTVPTRGEAAKMLNVGEASVGRAKQILIKSPELAERVSAGEITVYAAQQEIKREAEPITPDGPEQKETSEQIPNEGMAWAKKAIKCLEKIQQNDAQKKRAYSHIQHWLSLRH